ncbi:MAG: FG-GAP-like repeat-containing protein [Bacteroidales bacterium]|jgi:predicted nucleotidyltransferase|nr:FG-GAP-like repeat-containing protein [Bacteroidales bacterium]
MKKLLLLFILPGFFLLFPAQLIYSQTFTEQTTIILTTVSNSSAAWGDYDSDGDLDILLTGNGKAKIYRNDAGSFTDINAGLTGINSGIASWGDYDNDGDLDIIISGSYYTIIYRNDAGAFTDISAGLPGLNQCSAAWGDYDNDGDLDLLLAGVTSSGERISRIYRNDNNVFTDIEAGLTGIYASSVAWGDYDNDGDLDIVILGRSSINQMIAKIYRNDNGVFNDINAGLSGAYYGSVAWGDYDNDGDLDLLLTGSNYILKLYRNGAGIFSEVNTGLPGVSNSTAAWGDCDNDGDLDILIAGYSSTGEYISNIYRNDSGTFNNINAGLYAPIPRGSVAWGDYDGDGDLDILLTGGNVSKIYKNVSTTSNTVPSAPSGLAATSTGTGMVLSWNKSTDTKTLQTGLTYNLYIGTSSGAVNKRTPMAILPGGYRKIVKKSEIQSNSWTIKRLSAGTYYWSVQAVDNSFAGSGFATQTTFTVPFSNSVSPATDQVIAVNQASAALTVTESSAPTSRQWKYSTVNGGPYNQSISGATATTCSPSFPSLGTYYVICESTRSGIAYISNQVKITVSYFIPQTGLTLPGIQNGSSEWGDYDNDGDLDLLLTGTSQTDGYISRIYRNDTGIFTDIIAGLAGVSNSSASWGDYDNDGDLDIVLTGIYTSKIYRNDAGVFTDLNAGLVGVDYGTVKWGDYDNDGDLDLLLMGRASGSYGVSIIYNNNNGIFSDISAGLPGIYEGSAAWGDYDNDSDLDIILAGNNPAGGITRIFRNDNGTFTDINAGLTGLASCSVAWGDYDSDGDLDILMSGSYSTYIYNNNNGNFASVNSSLPALTNSRVAWGDYDNDGDLDICLSGKGLTGYVTRIFQNNNNSFSEVVTGLAAVYDGSVAWGDYDKDNDLDLIVTGTSSSGYFTKVYKNNIGTPNDIPSAPANLQTVIGGNKVTFTWNRSSDSKTGQAGLGYNLYVGTNSGSVNKKSPMSDVPGGFRRIVQKDGQVNTWYIKRLPAGNYFWAVQAIDNSFAGSSFSTEGSFTISYATSISPVNDQNLIINQSGTALAVSETSPADSRRWKYSTVSGGPYDYIITGATGTSYTPVFTDWGTYFVICESIRNSIIYKSNEVKIKVPLFTGLTALNLPGVSGSRMKWGDYDNDGYLDLLFTGNGGIVRIYRNTAGVFTDIAAGLPGYSFNSVEWGDYDNDGDLDILFSGPDYSGIYRNTAGVFADIGAGLPSGSYELGNATWGDYDNDGDLDILMVGDYNSYLYRNENGTYVLIDAGLPGLYAGSSEWGDYDNDGDLDILMTGADNSGFGVSRIYCNDRGNFSPVSAGLTSVQYGSCAWGDFDNDGDLDIIITGYDNNYYSVSKIYRNDNGIFADINAELLKVKYGSAVWGDYDNDGDPDIFLTGMSDDGSTVSKIYRNDNGLFTGIDAGLPAVQNGSAEWGDFDNDNDLDILISGTSDMGNISVLYRNNITTANSAPSTPSSLQSVPGSNKVTLSWSKSTDSGTPQNGLSYNIYIGTSSGSVNKKSPMAAVPGGYRRIVRKGYQSNTWIIKNLPVGNYWWSVQSIDNSFKGSAFPTENSFTVLFTNSISPTSQQSLGLSQNGTALTVTESAVPASRQWKYSTISGGPYSQNITGATGTSYTPNFSSFGSYYVVCESVYSTVTYTSNEVLIRVPYFKEQTGTGITDFYYQGSVKWGDYDSDGDLDILFTGEGTSSAKIYKNTAGIFSDIAAGLPHIIYSSAAWGDYDNDGDLDILISGYSTSQDITRIYTNDAGIFTNINAGLPGLESGSAVWGDYDNDGDLDILLSGNNFTKVFQNSNGDFSDVGANLAGVSSGSCAWGDYDSDGDPDIILTGMVGTTPISKIYRNDNGEFIDINADLNGVSKGSVAWGDYDSDGDLDLLLSGLSLTDPLAIIYKNTNGTFSDISAGLSGFYNSSAAWGDFDNDGDLDILISGNNSVEKISRIYRNDSGVFIDIKDGLTGVDYASVTWGDYDNDGDLDILLTGSGQSDYITKLYKNNITTSNSVPSAPANLNSSIGSNKVMLNWDKSTDSKTLPAGLTYNLYLGTAPGSVNKKSPMSALSGGYRKIVQKEIQTNSLTIKNLSSGTYYWSVQAIDNAFAGSAFATEAIFTVNYSTSISPIASQALSIYQNGNLLTVSESSPADSRQWKYSQVSGGPYSNIITGATATTWTPVFSAWGNYYVVCESVKGSVSYISNEVKIIVPVFLDQTGISVPGLFRGSIAWGDYDNDGDLDLFVNGLASPGVAGVNNLSRIYRNDGGTFTDIQAGIIGIMQGTGAWGDYDNDGDLDLIISGFLTSGGNYTSKIYRNDAGIFIDINAGLIGLNGASVAWGDYDNDGDLDLLMTGYTYSGSVSLTTKIYNNNNGVFSETNTGLPGLIGGSVAWGDYDNDGDLDILLTGDANYTVSSLISKIYRNDNGSFTDINAGLPGLAYGSCNWIDYDNDGDLDVLLTGDASSEPITTIFQNNNGSFSEIASGLTPVSSGSVACGDFDNDGDQDILLSGTGSSGIISKVFRNDGGVFTEINAGLQGVYNSSVAWGDYDNDGDLDIALSGWNSSDFYSKIYKNSCLLPNTKPDAPSNLVVTPESVNKVILSWNKSTDSQTAQDALNYNIRVGTTTGGSNIVGPMASATNGLRRIPARGNAGFKNTGYALNILTPGTYYWSVQAIDQAYTGGNWATESTFTLLEGPVATAATAITQTGFTANWGSSAGATGYRIDVATDAAFTSLQSGYSNKDVGNITSSTISGLTSNTAYYYRVRAYIATGTSIINSNTIPAKTLAIPPATPTLQSGSSCNDLVTLTWTAATEPNFLRYRIYGGISPNPSVRIDSTENGIASATTKTISGLNHGNTYYFRVTVLLSNGVSSQYSNEIQVTVKKGVIPKIKSKWNDVLICYNLGDSINLFQWYKGASVISGAIGQYYVTNKAAGSYSVLTTDKNGCINSSNIINLTGAKSLSVFPNPAENSFTLNLNSETLGRTMITLFNSSGVKVLEYEREKLKEELKCEIPADNLPSGTYTIEVLVNQEELSFSRVIVIN